MTVATREVVALVNPRSRHGAGAATAEAAAGEPAEFHRRVSDLAARLERGLDLRKAIRITTEPGLFVARR